MRKTSTSYVSTADAAEALGVSISTVKRWVDDGVLPAHKTAGGHRKLLAADILELSRRGELPRGDISQLVHLGRGAEAADPARFAEDLYRSLLEANADRVRALIHGSYRRGVAIEELADQAIGPVMERIGQAWEAGRIDVMDEHLASQLCAAALYELKAVLEKRARKHNPIAVGGAPEHDFSVLPTLLAQMVLLDSGWDAINLGPATPFESLCKAIRELRPRLLWLSVSHLGPGAEFVEGYTKMYQQATKANVAVALGGRALDAAIRSKVPYTAYGDGLSNLAAFAHTLHPRPRRPRRGRPTGPTARR